MNEPKVIFIRHSLKLNYQTDLRESERIAIQFESRPSINPVDYERKSSRSALELLDECCKSGAIVAATYKGVDPFHILIGHIVPNRSKIELNSRDDYWNKEVQLFNTKVVSYTDYPLLMLQPIKSTVSKWKIGSKTIQAIVKGQKLTPEIDLLHPSLLEVICYEFLRKEGRIDGLVLPIGRTLRDVDIWGLSKNGEQVIAQVTYAKSKKKVEDKLKLLKAYEGFGKSLIFFGHKARQNIVSDQSIEFIDIERVFNHLNSGEAGVFYQQLIRAMLGKIASN